MMPALAATYPTRAPANANALLIVRLTARFAYVLTSVVADGVPGSRNSMYASSTTTIGCTPSAAPATRAFWQKSRIRFRSIIGSAVPVGLFGLVSMTMDGSIARIASIVRSTSRVKSALRGAVCHWVNVSRAYSGYIEYVGSQPSAARPGPPKAWNIWSMISLDPFAPHTWSVVSEAWDSLAK